MIQLLKLPLANRPPTSLYVPLFLHSTYFGAFSCTFAVICMHPPVLDGAVVAYFSFPLHCPFSFFSGFRRRSSGWTAPGWSPTRAGLGWASLSPASLDPAPWVETTHRRYDGNFFLLQIGEHTMGFSLCVHVCIRGAPAGGFLVTRGRLKTASGPAWLVRERI